MISGIPDDAVELGPRLGPRLPVSEGFHPEVLADSTQILRSESKRRSSGRVCGYTWQRTDEFSAQLNNSTPAVLRRA
jgi:hypothetical protein